MNSEVKRILLIGYMGAGKTTVGKELARQLGVTFYDLDWYIETRMRMRVPEIFAQKGEEGFRELERNTGRSYDSLYIVGGGAKNQFLNRLTEEATGAANTVSIFWYKE